MPIANGEQIRRVARSLLFADVLDRDLVAHEKNDHLEEVSGRSMRHRLALVAVGPELEGGNEQDGGQPHHQDVFGDR
jgi:hypothetical protein